MRLLNSKQNMNLRTLCAAFVVAVTLPMTLPTVAQVKFEDYFLPKTMRLDYYHAGDAKTEHFYLDELIEEPYWAGNKHYLVDERNVGNHQFRVLDKATGKVIYQRGFNTLFNEWQCTPEAKTTQRAMPEGITFPYPKADVVVEFYTRENATGTMHKRWSYEVDVDSYFIRQARPTLTATDIHYTGNPAQRVDVVIIPEGYTEAEKALFMEAARQFAEDILSYAPYTEYRERFNFRAVWAPSDESGVTIPGERIWRNTVLDAHYYTFDSERYQMFEDYQRVLDIAAHVPYEIIYVLTNSQKYGGGGIYNFYGMSAANIPGASTRKTYSHEFGHLFVGLADEYVGGTEMSDLYFPDVEPWEGNITTLTDLDAKAWGRLLPADQRDKVTDHTGWGLNPQNPESPAYNPKRPWALGIYEGGGYLQRGVYRPWPNCMMNWFHTIDEYCPVCVEEIRMMIERYVR